MEKKINKYLSSVRRKLNLPKSVRQRCIDDLQTTIKVRLENGENWEQIHQTMGKPQAVAAQLQEQLQEFAYHKSKWRFAFLALAVLGGGCLAWYLGVTWFAGLLAGQMIESLGVIGGADGPTAVFVTKSAGVDWDLVLMLGALIVGIVGYWCLCRLGGRKSS